MKTAFYIIVAFNTIFFSCKKELNEKVTVIKDCTGAYLRRNGIDYKVYNLEKLSSFQNGTNVSASFKQLTECNDSANRAPTYFMIHQFDSWIEIKNIKE